MIGALIMTHSDNKGLILPSKIAPVQVAILTVFADKNPNVKEVAQLISNKLNLRTKIDSSDKGIGFKSQEWELKGAPIRIEIGPRDLIENKVVISIRNKETKLVVDIDELNNEYINNLIIEHDKNIYDSAKEIVLNKKEIINNISEIDSIVKDGKYGYAYWTEDSELEDEIKKNTGATIRCLIDAEIEGKCIHSGTKTNKLALFARAY